MDMRSTTNYRRRASASRDNDHNNSNSKTMNEDSASNNSMTSVKSISNRRHSLSSRHSISSPEMMHSPSADQMGRRRSSSRSSASASPLPVNSPGTGSRRNSVGVADSITSNNCSNNNNGHSSSPAGAIIPSTKNVGVGVNLGKANGKSNSLSSAGAQHILLNGHQHHQQRTPGTTVTTAPTNINSHNNGNNNGNSAAINLGHGHIGTITGPPSVSISGGLSGSSSAAAGGVNHNSSLSPSPAGSAPTTCTNKGVPGLNNQQQQQHLPNPSPQPSNLPMNHGLPEPPLQAGSEMEPGKSSNSSSSSSAPTSGNDGNGSGNGNNKNSGGGIRTGPNSPSSASSTSSCGGSKGEAQPNSKKMGTGTGSNEEGGSSAGSDSNTNRIVSQNVNGTLAVTGVPSNESELQLFRVLQRANLLSYFDMMIELGGDDVQQLCDAGEEEFLEIMALIGMASKPLHVRRLQKALQEWMTQPSLFQAPVLPPGYPLSSNTQIQQTLPNLAAATPAGISQIPIPHMPAYSPGSLAPTTVPVLFPGAPELISTPSDLKSSANSSKLTNPMNANEIHFANNNTNNSFGNPHANPFAAALAFQQALVAGEGGIVPPQLAAIVNNLNENNQQLQQQQQLHSRYNQQNQNHSSHFSSTSKSSEKEKGNSSFLPIVPMQMSDIKIPADQLIPSHFLETRIRTRSEPSSPGSSFEGSPHPDTRNSVSPLPHCLQDHEVQKLAEAAIHLIRSLPPSVAEPKFSSKRKTSGDYELILRLSESDPRRMEEVRRVAAVYGRADAKRKTYKPLSMHELAINEAATQLCKHVPALLTKREELLSLSRQVVRESGLPYSAISSTFSISILTSANGTNNSGSSSSSNSNNNNDINTKSKYEEINRHSTTSTSVNRDISSGSDGGTNSFFSGFPAKRCRLDGSSAGIEIQEYNGHGRPLSLLTSPSPPATSNGMQITELRCLPPRRSPSDDQLPSPLELVTVTTSDFRKNGGGAGVGMGSKSSSSVSSMDSNSPPIRRPYSVESADDLTTSSSSHINTGSGSQRHNHHHYHHLAQGMRISHPNSSGIHPAKIASIPVSGGSISIMNHLGSSGSNLHNNQQFVNRLHHHHSQYNHHGMKGMPIKSEPTVN